MTYEAYRAIEEALPSGPDRKAMVLHLTRSVNKSLAFVANDQDGIQKRDVVFLLENARRSLSVLKVYLQKTRSPHAEAIISEVLTAIRRSLGTSR